MNPDGPYLSVAALCDLVLVEKDERFSCIRFGGIANVTIPADYPDPSPPLLFETNAVIMLTSGGFQGTKSLTITLRNPSGKVGTKPTETFPAVFSGTEEQGVNLAVKLTVEINETGLFYFDVALDGELITRIPLRVNVTRTTHPQTEAVILKKV